MSHENQRYFIFASWKNGRNATQIHEELKGNKHCLSAQLDAGLLHSKAGKKKLKTRPVLDVLAKQ